MAQVLDDKVLRIINSVEFTYRIENLRQRTALGECNAVCAW